MNEQSEMSILRHHMAQTPVRITDIIEALGVTYLERPLPGSEISSIEYTREKFIITVNSSESEGRKRFAAAHELVHYIMHRDLLLAKYAERKHIDHIFGRKTDNKIANSGEITDLHDMQANRMAIQIMMPAEAVRKWHDLGETPAQLAQRFGVNEEVMTIRLSTVFPGKDFGRKEREIAIAA